VDGGFMRNRWGETIQKHQKGSSRLFIIMRKITEG
jgi:hypothetical protein